MATRRGILRRLIGGRDGAINRGGAARTLRAQKQLTWPAVPVRSTRQQRFAQASDETSNPPLKAGLFVEHRCGQWKVRWKVLSEPFWKTASETGFHLAGCERKETSVPSVFTLSKSCVNRHPHAIRRLRMRCGENSTARRWPGRWPLRHC